MLSYLFSCFEAIPSLPMPLFRLLPVYSCVQSGHIPKSPAKYTTPQLWTLITFFWLACFAIYFKKSLRYISRSFSENLLLFCALSKKLKIWIFFRTPSTYSRYYVLRGTSTCKKRNRCTYNNSLQFFTITYMVGKPLQK